MKKLTPTAIAGIALLSAGSAGAQSQLRIDCGATDVILTEEQVVSPRNFSDRMLWLSRATPA